jgi:hypothetical protein
VLATGDDRLVVAVGRGHGAEAGQPIGEHMAARCKVSLGPVSDRLLSSDIEN